MFTALLKSRRFAPVFWCQILLTLNGTVFASAVVVLILAGADGSGRMAPEALSLVALVGAVVIAPFLLLSGLAGTQADRADKAHLAQTLMLAGIAPALVAATGFVLLTLPGWEHWCVPLLFVALAGSAAIAALFGPVKYSLLPARLETAELPAANALVAGGSFLAFGIGTIVTLLSLSPAATAHDDAGLAAAAVAIVAVLAWLSARLIPATGAAAPGLPATTNPLSATRQVLRELTAEPRLRIGALITAWFWLMAAVAGWVLLQIVFEGVNGDAGVLTLGLVVTTAGIATGSVIAANASRNRPNLALVPVGAALMGVFCLDLSLVSATLVPSPMQIDWRGWLASVSGLHSLIDLAGLALAGGLFIVPAMAAVQGWAAPERRGRVMAACNALSAAFIGLVALAIYGLHSMGLGLPALFLILGLMNLAAFVLVLRAWGREGIRDLGIFLFKTFLGLEIRGRENLPAAGVRAIIAPNHVSLLDAPIIHSILPEHAAFAIDTGMSNKWWVKPFLKLVEAHPIDPTRPLGARDLINAIKGGETLVIFPEGRLTVTGGLMKVYDGTAMIADKADAVIVPVRIEGPERSHFGYLTASQTKKQWFPKTVVTILPPVKLSVDPALKGRARRQAAGACLQDIMTDTAVATSNIDQTLFEALVDAYRTRDTGKAALEDPISPKLSYKRLILAAQVLGRKLEPLAPVGGAVGVLLPNAVGTAVTFFALQGIGRVPAMLNFTAGAQSLLLAMKAANVDTVLTSRAFIEKGRLGPVIEALAGAAKIVYLDDVRTSITLADKLRGMLAGTNARVARVPNDPAVILFTSGSEGTPKGVVLSHRNLLANATQSLTRVSANGADKVFNVLPVFHSFGLTGGLIMPLVGGIPVYLYPSPLHYRIVPELVYQTNATILFGTDTFLNGYARSAHPYDFNHVRLIVAGAEAVKERTRQIYMEKFGVRILEGYGVTETAPVLAINTPLANRSGTVGRLSPLMEARLEPVQGIEDGGRLFVRGPNVMLGYYRAEAPGVLEKPPGGWHDTGDIVAIDAGGFMTIKGRAKRFAKVGGEMVSLAAVEAMASALWPGKTSIVLAEPDERKGERMVLMTTEAGARRDAFLRFAKAAQASDLMVPAEVMVVPAIPLLGSGKADYVAAQALLGERTRAAAAATTSANGVRVGAEGRVT